MALEATLNDPAGANRRVRCGKYEDFSQFLMNPYLARVLAGKIASKSGLYEIILPPNVTSDSLIYHSSLSKEVMSIIGPMLATKPPCRFIDVYIDYGSNWSHKWPLRFHQRSRAESTSKELRRVACFRSDTGITCEELLDTLSTGPAETA
jgi:hypothetical protein